MHFWVWQPCRKNTLALKLIAQFIFQWLEKHMESLGILSKHHVPQTPLMWPVGSVWSVACETSHMCLQHPKFFCTPIFIHFPASLNFRNTFAVLKYDLYLPKWFPCFFKLPSIIETSRAISWPSPFLPPASLNYVCWVTVRGFDAVWPT